MPTEAQSNENRARRRPGRPAIPLENRKELLSCNLEPGQLRRLREESDRRDVSLTFLIREAVDLWARSL